MPIVALSAALSSLSATACAGATHRPPTARTRPASSARGITPCIPPCKNRKTVIEYDKALYRQRHRIENTFGRLKDLRRIATRYDRCAYTCFSAICIAATVIFWLGE